MKVQAATPPDAKRVFTTISGSPVEALYGPEQIQDLDPVRDLGACDRSRFTKPTQFDVKRFGVEAGMRVSKRIRRHPASSDPLEGRASPSAFANYPVEFHQPLVQRLELSNRDGGSIDCSCRPLQMCMSLGVPLHS
jgi:hypothetical protein